MRRRYSNIQENKIYNRNVLCTAVYDRNDYKQDKTEAVFAYADKNMAYDEFKNQTFFQIVPKEYYGGIMGIDSTIRLKSLAGDTIASGPENLNGYLKRFEEGAYLFCLVGKEFSVHENSIDADIYGEFAPVSEW